MNFWLSKGHRYQMVMVSMTKRVLQGKMPSEMRLEFLSYLEKMVDNTLTAGVIAIIDPMDDDGQELYMEAVKLGYGPRSPNVFDVLDEKFDVFASLNPSLRRAYDQACRPWANHGVTA
jgi:hypothetical protein